ncbi:MAG TPA: ABC transporter permease [Candidatus Atribacteria bacterium]|uniref:Inner-membrane translocator n=1 Tax=candidate division TA06 bacterium 34_109 TaxID=1635277 RepID=A0A101I095_UNCT6|nr:MAG: Inner-membrane translocator [candidate division TA06 bacterium 34_109]HBY57223.1 ABC transporter permease [Candidatus Atribacteria bacterium]
MNLSTLASWFAMSIRLSIPLLYAALGGLILFKSGVFNMGLEGMMLIGAFLGFYGVLVTDSLWIGLLTAIIGGALLGLLLAYVTVSLGGNQLVIGLGINFFILGLTGFFFRLLCNSGLVSDTTRIANFSSINIPFLSTLPFLGEIFFKHNFLTYLAILLVILINWFFYKTTYGLGLLAVGESPETANSAGINVYLIRYIAAIISGILAATGGAFLTLTQVTRFSENITDGRGWLALAVIIFGKYTPWGTLGASLVFGAGLGLVLQLQVLGVKIPIQIVQMLPYVLTIAALIGVVGKVRGPSALGRPFVKD